MTPFNNIGNIPFDSTILASLFPKNKHINEKARALEKSGKIIRLKKGLYVASPEETGKPLCPQLHRDVKDQHPNGGENESFGNGEVHCSAQAPHTLHHRQHHAESKEIHRRAALPQEGEQHKKHHEAAQPKVVFSIFFA